MRFNRLILTLAIASSSFAQAQATLRAPSLGLSPAVIKDLATARPLDIEAYDMDLPSKPSVASKPYKMLDPKTGKEVSASTMLDLGEGKKMTAGEYYAAINKMEKAFAAQGFSLQSFDGDDMGVIQAQASTLSLLNEQNTLAISSIKAIQVEGAKLSAFLNPDLLSFSTSDAGASAMAAPTLAAKCAPGARFKNEDGWPKTWGNSKFALKLNSNVEFEASCVKTFGQADGSVDATVFKKNFNVAKAKFYAEGNPTGYVTDGDIIIVGKKVKDFDKKGGGVWNKSDSFGPSISAEFKMTFNTPYGNIVGRTGASGSAKIDYQVKIKGLSALAKVEPNLQASAFLEISYDIYIAGAGAGGKVLLVKLALPISALAEVVPAGNKIEGHGKLTGQLDIRALDGKIYIHGYVRVPYWKPPFTKKLKGQYDVADWKGVSLKRTLFNLDKRANLSNNAS